MKKAWILLFIPFLIGWIQIVPIYQDVPISDIYEDFQNDYTEVDGGSVTYTRTTTRCTWATLSRNEHSWVYYDFGANHFSGDFEFWFEIYIDASTGHGSWGGIIALTNDLDAEDDIVAANGNTQFAAWYDSTVSGNNVFTYEIDGGDEYAETGWHPNLDTLYYCTLTRDDDGGTGSGLLLLQAYASAADRTADDNELTGYSGISLKNQIDYRYLLVGWARDDGKYEETWDGYIENLEIKSP